MEKYLRKKFTSRKKIKGLFEIYALALERQSLGKKVVHMEIGRPDFDTPQIIKDAAVKALGDGLIYYTEPSGVLPLRQAITDKTKKMIGIDYNPKTEAIITVGASEALDLIWKAFLDEDDEVIIPSPFYGAYTFQLDYSDKKYVTVPILNEDGTVEYDLERFKKALSPRTKMILINSPNNPTGYVMSKEDLQAIANFAIKNDLIVISDECYDHFVFEGEYMSIASLPGMRERTLVVNSTSKTFAMTGWRIGYVLGQSKWIEALVRIHAQTVVCPSSFAQVGAVAAYSNEIPELDVMKKAFLERKEYISEALKEIEDVTYVAPKGAFYIFMNVSKLNMAGIDFCEELLQEYGVTLSPGNNFGLEWENYVRISYACSLEDIKYAMNSIKRFVESKISVLSY